MYVSPETNINTNFDFFEEDSEGKPYRLVIREEGPAVGNTRVGHFNAETGPT